jgi:hypothetical protein
MAELVDALDLGSSAARREGSSPFIRMVFNLQLLSKSVLALVAGPG